jgi:hypothetical protein
MGLLALVSLFLFAPMAAAQPAAATEIVDSAKDLAKRIDVQIEQKLNAAKVPIAPQASDTEFFRRLNLDLAGHIPTLLQCRDFLDDESSGKRAVWTENLFDSDRFATHFSQVWGTVLLSNRAEANLLAQRQGFERWLRDRFKLNQGFDQTAKELMAQARKSGEPGSPNAFIAYHGGKPEEQSGAVARVFLGIKIECAQCHPHPFAKWSKQQFWEFAAFFDPKGIKPAAEKGSFLRPQIPMPGTGKLVKARFLDGSEPPETLQASPKTTLANWIASKDNPYFAKAAADHVWSYFFGVSLLEPILETEKDKDKSALTHPELLNLLANELIEHDFDLRYLIRSIVYTNAYQRSSKGTDDEQLALFGRMPIRALSAEQLFDSFMVATNSKMPGSSAPNALSPSFPGFKTAPNERSQFLLKFYDTAKATEASTSILQALYLMNSKFLNDRIDAKSNSMLPVLAATAPDAKRQLQTLYLMVLSRPPSAKELERLAPIVSSGGVNGDRVGALRDVLWALLNSTEFALNH